MTVGKSPQLTDVPRAAQWYNLNCSRITGKLPGTKSILELHDFPFSLFLSLSHNCPWWGVIHQGQMISGGGQQVSHTDSPYIPMSGTSV